MIRPLRAALEDGQEHTSRELLFVPRRSSAATPWSPLSAQLTKAWTDPGERGWPFASAGRCGAGRIPLMTQVPSPEQHRALLSDCWGIARALPDSGVLDRALRPYRARRFERKLDSVAHDPVGLLEYVRGMARRTSDGFESLVEYNRRATSRGRTAERSPTRRSPSSRVPGLPGSRVVSSRAREGGRADRV